MGSRDLILFPDSPSPFICQKRMTTLTSRMQAVQSPLIPIVGELIRSNPGTISLGQGVVYYDPPPDAIAFLSKFLADSGNHK